MKVAFVSNRFENPLKDIFVDGIQLKTQIRLLNLSQMNKQFFNIGITFFIRLASSMEEEFSQK